MIHQIFALKRPLIVYDTETTGLDTKKDRIIEIGFQIWDSNGLKKEWKTLVNPGIPIPPKATETHHITDHHVRRCQICQGEVDRPVYFPMMEADLKRCVCPTPKFLPTFGQLANNLAKGFTDVDFAGKHVRYDLQITASEMERVGVTWSYMGARIIDVDRLEQLGEPRSLSHLYKKHIGQEPVDAHEALADVRMTTEIISAQLRKYSTLPHDLDMLHSAQWPGWLDPDGKFRMVDGVACCTFGKWAGKPMSAIDAGYWDWILKSDFSADIKLLASNAKLKKFPKAEK